MNRHASNFAAVPALEPGDRIEVLGNDGKLLTIQQLAERTQQNRSSIDKDVQMGMPCIDVGRHHPDRRRKRTLRFDWVQVIRWYSERQQ